MITDDDFGGTLPFEGECPAGGEHVAAPNSDAAPMPFSPGWHCDHCGASLPSPERDEP